jgi:hypothetical protein
LNIELTIVAIDQSQEIFLLLTKLSLSTQHQCAIGIARNLNLQTDLSLQIELEDILDLLFGEHHPAQPIITVYKLKEHVTR